jgi:carbon-monoxide dehydrogenase catalytic subunit
MAEKTLLIEKRLRSVRKSLDDDTEEMIKHTESMGIDTVFSRQGKYDESFLGIEKARCSFGSTGVCCRQCAMGPCRIWNEDLPLMYKITTPKLNKGTCGASADTIVARNLLMMVARGTAAHASHAQNVSSALLRTAQNKTSYKIKEPEKLRNIAAKLKLDISNGTEKTAIEAASIALSDILGNESSMRFAASYCPDSVGKNLVCLGAIPGSVGKELLEEGHVTSMGTMTDPTSLIIHAARLGVADIASLIIGSEFQDVLFGIPKPVFSKIGFSVLEKNKVNVVIHGHVPLLSEKIVEMADDKEIMNRARALGALGINIVGCCCTGNEVLMRHGVPLAGSNLQQELIIATGLVEAFVVDVQCIYPNIENVAGKFHTKIITTMKEARLTGAEHIPFDEENADDTARKILEKAVENFQKRGKNIFLPEGEPKDLMAGFSVETCIGVLSKINSKDPLKPLIDNIASGNIYGVVLLAGCTSPKVTADASHVTIAKELVLQNVLIIATGCAAQACARAGLLTPDATEKYAGDKLKSLLNVLGKTAGLDKPLPPIWHFGSCVDNSRVVILLAALAEKLGVPIKDLPVAASAAEWVTEKAAAIGTGAMALGVTVHLGVTPPVLGSPIVVSLLTQKSEELFGGKFIVEIDPVRASTLLLGHIADMRKKMGLVT